METHFSTRDVISLFSVSHETVKNWAGEFSIYLSPTATPQAGSRRAFTPEDMTVFALVSDFRSRGLSFSDIHAALKLGQRGSIPEQTALDKIPPVVRDMVLTLRTEIEDLRSELTTERAKTNQAVGQASLLRELLKEQMAEKEQQIRELIEENARLKAEKRD